MLLRQVITQVRPKMSIIFNKESQFRIIVIGPIQRSSHTLKKRDDQCFVMRRTPTYLVNFQILVNNITAKYIAKDFIAHQLFPRVLPVQRHPLGYAQLFTTRFAKLCRTGAPAVLNNKFSLHLNAGMSSAQYSCQRQVWVGRAVERLHFEIAGRRERGVAKADWDFSVVGAPAYVRPPGPDPVYDALK